MRSGDDNRRGAGGSSRRATVSDLMHKAVTAVDVSVWSVRNDLVPLGVIITSLFDGSMVMASPLDCQPHARVKTRPSKIDPEPSFGMVET